MIEYYIKEQEFKQFGENENKKRYFARIDEKTMLDTDELCQRVADCSTLAKPEMRLAIDMACDMIYEALKGGRSVRLGDLGVLHPTIKSKICERKEDVTIDTITDITCSIRLSEKLKKALRNEHVRKITLPNS
ncbi:MAG: HU family DNA-binding protein [Bacteroidales bacterium]|nr:HU family DNA-binding protein [Bacteroidales bacterium]